MGADQHFDWLASAASALDWWQEAGVDLVVETTPRDWMAAPEPVAIPAPGATPARTPAPAPAPVAPTAPAAVTASALPDDLAAFLAWRMSAAAPEAAWRGTAIPASGPTDAAVMVLVDCPDADDGAGGALLGGAAGRLFDRMLAAIGLNRDAIHLAAVCTRRPVAGQMPRDIEARLGEVARHHVALAAPRRLLCLGNAASRAILGTEGAAAAAHLHVFNHRNGQTAVVTSLHPRLLLERPAMKAEAWRDLQLLMGDD